MGIPKFFRWISERYPLCSQLISENNVPEFDNLYLDMNGIIHNCSHPNDENVHFRLSEDQIFTAIFNYIDFLFQIIKPKKLFFMALDGVAPRAKMNQQRARRFRTAKDSEELRKEAIGRGEKLPTSAPFDSNCITPGTEFMAKLTQHLKYFIHKKVSEDRTWRSIQIVLSGHEVPGEGEHKIMEYIRLHKAQNDYEANKRHCLYGLDADLIMLGLLAHEPNFALLREEVTFGRIQQKKKTDISQLNFYLMHLCLVRQYLQKDFEATLGPGYSLERIIDDFILISILVGNDFLPNLPHLMINEGGFQHLFSAYKRTLARGSGHLNDYGTLNLANFQIMFDELASFEIERFRSVHEELEWMEKKRVKNTKSKLKLTKTEQNIYRMVKDFVLNPAEKALEIKVKESPFLHVLTKELNLVYNWVDDNTVLIDKSNYVADGSVDDSDTDEIVLITSPLESQEENTSFDRVFFKYESAVIESDEEDSGHGKVEKSKSFLNYKDSYYKEKMHFGLNDQEKLDHLVFKYIEGIQWVLFYYYCGVCSWAWYFPYHYAPCINDIKNIANLKFEFEKGKPFRPFEQLMGVLPAASQTLIPPPFRELMTDPSSPIIDFYPTDFRTDLNGKKNDWEAIVLIPFIEEERLINALSVRESRLTPDEIKRNEFGVSIQFHYDGSARSSYPSSLPGIFPEITSCFCKTTEFELPILNPGQSFVKVLATQKTIDPKIIVSGFPNLTSIKHSSYLAAININVFNVPSKYESLVVQPENVYENQKILEMAMKYLNKQVFTNWPCYFEGKLVGLSDSVCRYSTEKKHDKYNRADIIQTPHTPQKQDHIIKFMERVEEQALIKRGLNIGTVSIIAHVKLLKQMVMLDTGAIIKEFEEKETEVPLQLCCFDLPEAEDPRFKELPAKPLKDEFPILSKAIFLGNDCFGDLAMISEHDKEGGVDAVVNKLYQLNYQEIKSIISSIDDLERYEPTYNVSRLVGVSGLVLSKLTSSCHVYLVETEDRINIGLNIKFEMKGLKVIGYTRRNKKNQWEFSSKAIELLMNFKAQFPDLFERMEIHARTEPLTDHDLFPDNTERLFEIRKWVKANASNLPNVSCDITSLSTDAIKKIEKYVDDYVGLYKDKPSDEVLFRGLQRKDLLKPETAHLRLRSQALDIGDRVVYALDVGNVPLGAKGTVVGVITSNLYEVMFDVPFIGGNTLGGRCSPYRGAVVEKCTLLNTSNLQNVASPSGKGLFEAPTVGFMKAKKVEANEAPQTFSNPNTPKKPYNNNIISFAEAAARPSSGRNQDRPKPGVITLIPESKPDSKAGMNLLSMLKKVSINDNDAAAPSKKDRKKKQTTEAKSGGAELMSMIGNSKPEAITIPLTPVQFTSIPQILMQENASKKRNDKNVIEIPSDAGSSLLKLLQSSSRPATPEQDKQQSNNRAGGGKVITLESLESQMFETVKKKKNKRKNKSKEGDETEATGSITIKDSVTIAKRPEQDKNTSTDTTSNSRPGSATPITLADLENQMFEKEKKKRNKNKKGERQEGNEKAPIEEKKEEASAISLKNNPFIPYQVSMKKAIKNQN